MMTVLTTIGYTRSDGQERIDTFLADPLARLVDIRLTPRSRFLPQFNRSRMVSHYPEQYVWIHDLGNINHRKEDREKGIVILNPDAGVARVMELLTTGHPVMLLCACKGYDYCHRKVVYELLKTALRERKSRESSNERA